MGKMVRIFAKLCSNEPANLQWDGFAGSQQSARVPKCAKLQCKTKPVAGMPPGKNMLNVIVGQGVVVEYRALVSGQIKKR